MKSRLEDILKARAITLGFDVCRITKAELSETTGTRLDEFVTKGNHGSMEWLSTTLERRRTPRNMWDGAKSAIMLGMNYGPDSDPLENLLTTEKATISVYAQNRDYHDIIKGKLKTLAGWISSQTQSDVKVFVDTAPLMEKPLAQQSGLGWQGKHTNLVSREFGSWLFLGAILSAAEFEPDREEIDHCGSCQSCLDICPTDAFPAPYQLDARKCISYLTIEHAGPIPREIRSKMGNRIYGCDDCLAVCPWNKYAKRTAEAKLAARDELRAPDLAMLATLDDKDFRTFFSGSPIKRIGRNRFIRNVLIAIGNSKTPELLQSVKPHLEDPDPVVRSAAVWAYSRLEQPETFHDMRKRIIKQETDASVHEEWQNG